MLRPPIYPYSLTHNNRLTMPQVTKLDAARRQLVTAICLHFSGGDPISIYSLATNAWEIIDELCQLRKIDSLSEQSRANISQGRYLKRDYINSPYRNFFKHADTDPEATLPEIPCEQVDGILFLAVEDYIRLLNKSPLELQVFQLWYLAMYRSKIQPTELDEIAEYIQHKFPSIEALERADQLAQAQRVLSECRCSSELLADPRTEK